MDQEALVSILKVVITALVGLGTNLQLTGDPALVRVNLVMCLDHVTLDSFHAFISLVFFLSHSNART